MSNVILGFMIGFCAGILLTIGCLYSTYKKASDSADELAQVAHRIIEEYEQLAFGDAERVSVDEV